MHGPRGGPSRPGPTFRPNGGFDGSGGGGGMAFDEQHIDPFRPAHTSPGYSTTRPQHDDFPSSYGAGTAAHQQTRFSPPLRRPNYTANDMAATTEMRQQQQQQNMMSRTNPFASGYGMPQGGHDPNLYNSSGAGLNSSSAGYTSAATAGPSNLRSAMKHNVAFQDDSSGTESAHLTRPREEETARGEANAGAMPDKRDGLGTL